MFRPSESNIFTWQINVCTSIILHWRHYFFKHGQIISKLDFAVFTYLYFATANEFVSIMPKFSIGNSYELAKLHPTISFSMSSLWPI